MHIMHQCMNAVISHPPHGIGEHLIGVNIIRLHPIRTERGGNVR